MRAKEGRDEFRVNERGLLVLEALGDFTGDAEVRVLVDRAGDEARDVGLGAEDLGERVGEGGGGLDRDKVPLADVVAADGKDVEVSGWTCEGKEGIRTRA